MKVNPIGLVLPRQHAGLQRLLSGLSDWSGVSFRIQDRPDPNGVNALLVVTEAPGPVVEALRSLPVPALVIADPARTSPGAKTVRFADREDVDRSLRGATLPEPEGVGPAEAPLLEGGIELASKGNQPAWMRWPSAGGGVDLSLVGVPLLAESGYLHEHFGIERFLSLLPWLDFVRRVRGSDGWDPAPLRACVVFDDPSLYRPTYGYVDFEQIAQYAAAHRHHVGIATVPLDLAGARPGVADIFRERSASLSLLVHGNDHLNAEMARERSPKGWLQMTSQIERRIRRFEQKHRVPIARVMEAPHAAFAPEAFPALLAVGFEGVFITPERLRLGHHAASWSPAWGLAADGSIGGLPWANRIRWRDGWLTDVLLAAYLRQPMVVAGHHPDIARGLGALGEIAKAINRQGDVHWSPADELVRRRVRSRRENETLFLQTHSHYAKVSVPPGVRSVVWEFLGTNESGPQSVRVEQAGKPLAALSTAGSTLGPIPVTEAGELIVRRAPPNAVDAETISSPRVRAWPMMRKAIMELRDRTQPTRERWRFRRGNQEPVGAPVDAPQTPAEGRAPGLSPG